MSSVSSKKTSDVEAQYAAQEAQKKRLREEHEAEMDRLKENFSTEQAHTRDRFETSVQAERDQGYENLKNLKKQTERDAKDLMDRGNEYLTNKKDEYTKEDIRINNEGRAKVEETRKRMAAAEEYQRNQATNSEKLAKSTYAKNVGIIQKDFEAKTSGFQDEKMRILERRRGEHAVAADQIRDHYDKRQNNLLHAHEKNTQHIKDATNSQLNSTRLSEAQRIDSHNTKYNDPFYHMARVDSDFYDNGDHYILRVNLPEYERKGFRVQIAGQELQLSGSRTNVEKAEVSPGHEIDTRSYQNFAERYKFDVPVDARAMRVTEDEDGLEYVIPKFGKNHRMGAQDAYARKQIKKEELELTTDIEFKDTLPKPRIRNDEGSGTLS